MIFYRCHELAEVLNTSSGYLLHGFYILMYIAKENEEYSFKNEPPGKNELYFFVYRSVFFNGQIEKQVSGLTSLLDHPDIPVRVAVNRDAVHVIDPKKNVSLVTVCCKATTLSSPCKVPQRRVQKQST